MTNSKAVTDRYLPPPSEAQMYWYNHLKPHQASGLSLVEYAKQKNLSKNTLNYWSQLWRIPKEIGQPEMALCNGQVKPDTFLSHFPIEFPLKNQRRLIA